MRSGAVGARPLGHTALRMVRGAVGPVLAAVALFALPVAGAALLPTEQFAMWAILGSISTVSMSLDLGGVALATARYDHEHRGGLFWRCSALSTAGSVVVGLVAAVAWVPFSRTGVAAVFTFGEGLAAIALTTAGCAARGAVLVLAQFALSAGRMRFRNVLLTGQAFAAAALTIAVAVATGSAWSLPVGWSASAVAAVAAGLVHGRRTGLFGAGSREPARDHRRRMLTFGGYRAFATLANAVIFQSDRWIVGALGGAALLASYEIAWRVGSMPKFLVQQLSASLGPDAAARVHDAEPAAAVGELWRRSRRICLVAALAVGLTFAAAYPVVVALTGVDPVWVWFLLMLVAFSANGMTTPLTTIGIGTGSPWLDARYLAATLVGCAAAVVTGFVTHDAAVYVVGNLLALALGCAWFFRYAPRLLAAELDGVARSVDGARA